MHIENAIFSTFLCLFIDGLDNFHADQMFRTTAGAKVEGFDPVNHV